MVPNEHLKAVNRISTESWSEDDSISSIIFLLSSWLFKLDIRTLVCCGNYLSHARCGGLFLKSLTCDLLVSPCLLQIFTSNAAVICQEDEINLIIDLNGKFRRESFPEDFDDPETTFQERSGKKWYSWTYHRREDSSFHSSAFGFEWQEHSNWTNQRTKNWETTSDIETDDTDDEFCAVGSYSDRTILGLPPRGPLKIEDVKNAFRLSALKWHPDKRQGSSQAKAEEKFKLCANAYKSLCDALSAA